MTETETDQLFSHIQGISNLLDCGANEIVDALLDEDLISAEQAYDLITTHHYKPRAGTESNSTDMISQDTEEDVAKKIKRLEFEKENLMNAWARGADKWQETHDSIPGQFSKIALLVDSLTNDHERLRRDTSTEPKEPISIITGLPLSQSLYCCLCYTIITPEQCNTRADGTQEDVCIPCAQKEDEKNDEEDSHQRLIDEAFAAVEMERIASQTRRLTTYLTPREKLTTFTDPN